MPNPEQQQKPTRRFRIHYRSHRSTNPLVWFVVIICTIFAVAVIVAGLITLIGYMIIRPKVPAITVTYSHLDRLDYDQLGYLTTQITLDMTAENRNSKAHASFSNTQFFLRFHGLPIADLRADPFDVPKNSSKILEYIAQASPIPLDKDAMEDINKALNKNVISFDLEGSARARWRLGPIDSVNFWIHLSCKLQFLTPVSNGSSINTHCSTKAH